jgi:dTDP-4-dehydrorhamnose reductase
LQRVFVRRCSCIWQPKLIPLTYISTAGVFDGCKESPYTEFDQPNPINVYGASKFQGEQIIRATLPNHYIVRAGWMVGGRERDRKFVMKILAQLKKGVSKIYAVTDRRGTPTYAPAFSSVLEELIRTNQYGTYHLACTGSATRYDVAQHILRILGRQDVKLEGVTSDYFKEEYFAPRPVSEEMRNYVLELRNMNTMPHWKTALEAYLKESFSEFIAKG